MKTAKYVFVLILLAACTGCGGTAPKYGRGDVVYLNGSKVRVVFVDARLVSENRYRVRFFGFSSAPDKGLLSNGQEKMTYGGTTWVREWELNPHK